MNVKVVAAEGGDEPVLRNLLQLYQYDFSEFMEGSEVGDDGLFGFVSLDEYWTEADRYPFLVRVDGKLAGFALVMQHSHLTGERDTTDMDEFFIMRKYRRRGVGREVATSLFDMFPGRWEVREVALNVAAQAFWREVIGAYTGGRYEERMIDGERQRGLVQSFQAFAER